MAAQIRVRKKKQPEAEAPKKRAPRKEKDPLKGPLLLPANECEKARERRKIEAAKRKHEPQEPTPDDWFVSEEEDKERMVEEYRSRIHNPMSAIRAFCVSCMGGYLAEIKRCDQGKEQAKARGDVRYCPLHEFRLGNNPYHTRVKKKGESDDD